jgi:hypothetical protein
MLMGNTTVTKVSGLNPSQEQAIKHFLQGAVYAWCNMNKNIPFMFRDLMGGDNYYWQNTPLEVLYDKHKDETEAAKDAGKLLKTVLKEDQNKTFDQKKITLNNTPINKYTLI